MKKPAREKAARPAKTARTERSLAPGKISPDAGRLFERIVSILEDARARVVRSVNSEMVLTYWQIGREIVQSLQGGGERAAHGKQLIVDLSDSLTQRLGRGFSTTNLWYFRQFYLAYADRPPKILHKASGEFATGENLHKGSWNISTDRHAKRHRE